MTEQAFLLFGILTFGLPLLGVWLFDFLGQRKKQKDAESGHNPLGVSGNIAGTEQRQRGEAQHPRYENGGWPGCTKADGKAFEHIAPNVECAPSDV